MPRTSLSLGRGAREHPDPELKPLPFQGDRTMSNKHKEINTEQAPRLVPQISILLIEAQAFSRFLIRHELEKRGFVVRTARSKLEAADLLAGPTAPDFLILGDLSVSRLGPYRIISLPNSRARLKGAQLAGHQHVPKIPRPLTAVDLARKVQQLVDQKQDNPQDSVPERDQLEEAA